MNLLDLSAVFQCIIISTKVKKTDLKLPGENRGDTQQLNLQKPD